MVGAQPESTHTALLCSVCFPSVSTLQICTSLQGGELVGEMPKRGEGL